jgi:hypothetical protein
MPNISATGATIYWHPNKEAFDVAALIHNAGEPASGPIDITINVTYVSGYDGILGSDDVDAEFSYSQVTVTLPAGVTLDSGETYRSSYYVDIPFVAMPFEDYNYAAIGVDLDADGHSLGTFQVAPSTTQVPLPPPGYYETPGAPPAKYWWKLQPHYSGMRPPQGPVIGLPTKAHA